MHQDRRHTRQLAYEIAKGFISSHYPDEVGPLEWTWNIARENLLPKLESLHPSQWQIGQPELADALAAAGVEESPSIPLSVILLASAILQHVNEKGHVPSEQELVSVVKQYGDILKIAGQLINQFGSYLGGETLKEFKERKAYRLPEDRETRKLFESLKKVDEFPAPKPDYIVVANGEPFPCSREHYKFILKNRENITMIVDAETGNVSYLTGKGLEITPFDKEGIPFNLIYVLCRQPGTRWSRKSLCMEVRKRIDQDIEAVFDQVVRHIDERMNGSFRERFLLREGRAWYLSENALICVIEPYQTLNHG